MEWPVIPRGPGYVDDTFTVLHMNLIEEFTNHINSLDPNFKFTIEKEQDGRLPSLDTSIIVNDDGTLRTMIINKPTHTDQYLNWDCNHHLEHKTSVVRTLLRRAETVISHLSDREGEVRHMNKALSANRYKKWSF